MYDINAQSKRVVAEANLAGLHPFQMAEEPPLSPAELHEARHLLSYAGYSGGYQGGSFTSSLIRCFEAADGPNTERLLSAFPAYRRPFEIMNRGGSTVLRLWVNEASQDTK